MNDRIDIRLLDRVLAGSASDEELAALKRWLAAHPQEVITETRSGLATGDGDWDVDAGWRRLQSRLARAADAPVDWAAEDGRTIADTASDADRHPFWAPLARLGSPVASAAGSSRRGIRFVGGGGRWRGRTWIGAGAALAAAVAGLVMWRAGLLPSYATPRESAAPLAELVTGAGRRATLRLPDGTTVRLDAGGRLRYPTIMPPGAARELALDGQAYFDVQHDAKRPFIVRAGGAVIRDLGTEFGVTAYRGTPVRVVVARGSVALGPGHEASGGRTLTPGQIGSIDPAGHVAVRTVDIRPYLAWIDGVLAFDGRPLGEAVPELGRWYGVEIRASDSLLARRPLTAEFRDEPLPQVLDAIAMALSARWVRTGNTINFLPARLP